MYFKITLFSFLLFNTILLLPESCQFLLTSCVRHLLLTCSVHGDISPMLLPLCQMHQWPYFCDPWCKTSVDQQPSLLDGCINSSSTSRPNGLDTTDLCMLVIHVPRLHGTFRLFLITAAKQSIVLNRCRVQASICAADLCMSQCSFLLLYPPTLVSVFCICILLNLDHPSLPLQVLDFLFLEITTFLGISAAGSCSRHDRHVSVESYQVWPAVMLAASC